MSANKKRKRAWVLLLKMHIQPVWSLILFFKQLGFSSASCCLSQRDQTCFLSSSIFRFWIPIPLLLILSNMCHPIFAHFALADPKFSWLLEIAATLNFFTWILWKLGNCLWKRDCVTLRVTFSMLLCSVWQLPGGSIYQGVGRFHWAPPCAKQSTGQIKIQSSVQLWRWNKLRRQHKKASVTRASETRGKWWGRGQEHAYGHKQCAHRPSEYPDFHSKADVVWVPSLHLFEPQFSHLFKRK